MCRLPGNETETRTDPGGQVPGRGHLPGFPGKLPGRGAYLCPDSVCLARARKSKALERAFAQAIPPEVYERLEEQMKEVPGDAP